MRCCDFLSVADLVRLQRAQPALALNADRERALEAALQRLRAAVGEQLHTISLRLRRR